MKRIKVLLVLLVLAVLLTAVFLVGCNNPSGGNNDTADGAIKIVNVSDDYRIVQVEIYDATTDGRVFNQRVNIEPGDSRTFSIAPGKYYVWILDDVDDDYESNQITINSGATVTLNYTGIGLR